MVREDELIEDLPHLVGPKLFDGYLSLHSWLGKQLKLMIDFEMMTALYGSPSINRSPPFNSINNRNFQGFIG